MPIDQSAPIGPSTTHVPTGEDLLNAALASAKFRDSPRQRELLRYLIAEELAGRGDKLDAYAIAFDVLNRDSSFDPATDSNVRVEMHRLRQNLAAWNKDPENTLPQMLVVPARSYRIQIRPRTDAAAANKHKRWLPNRFAMMLAALGIVLAGLAIWWITKSPDCRSARPVVVLPTQIENLQPTRSDEMLDRLETFFQYYPLVTALRNSSTPCEGVPKYNLAIVAGKDGLQVSVTDRDTQGLVWMEFIELVGNASDNDRDLALARIAYMVAYDQGAVPINALRRQWTLTVAQDSYACVMLAHQFFTTSGNPTSYRPARECLIRIFKTANKADVPAMLAAMELEAKFEPELAAVRKNDYFDEAIEAAIRIDPYNSELLITRLRQASTKPDKNTDDIQVIINQMAQVYPLEPHILFQTAKTRCRHTKEYDKAFIELRTMRRISKDAVKFHYPEMVCNIATGNAARNAPFVDEMFSDSNPLLLIYVLNYALATGDTTAADKALARLADSGCKNRECATNLVKKAIDNPDMIAQLSATIDHFFPAKVSILVRPSAISPNNHRASNSLR